VNEALTVRALPPLAVMPQTSARFAALGLRIHVTELDVRMPRPATATNPAAPAQNHRDSWTPRTVAGRGAAPSFDADFQPKPAYAAVRTLVQGS